MRQQQQPVAYPSIDAGRATLAAWLLRHTHALLAPLVGAVLARIANQMLGVALLVIAATAVAAAAGGGVVDTPAVVTGLVVVSLAKGALRYLEHYAGHWVAFTALARLRELFIARLIPQAPAATQGRAGAELTERATRDIDRIEVFFAHTLPPAVSAVMVPAIALWWLAGTAGTRLVAVIAPFVAVVVLLVPAAASGITWRSARSVADRRGELARRLGDDIQGVREVLSFGICHDRLDGLDEADRRLTSARLRAGLIQAGRAAAITAVQAACLIAVVAAGAAAVSTGTLDTRDVAAALAVAVGLWGPARGVDDFVAGLDAAFAATARVRQVVDAPPVVRDTARPSSDIAQRGPARPAAGETAVQFDAVTFRFSGRPASPPVLDHVCLRIPAGTWTCIVGASGSGKSTLSALLLRGWDPDGGAIRLYGTDLRDLPLDQLRRTVALVPQRPTLLSGTVADNLRLAAPAADDAAVRDALVVAGLEDWLATLPDGLQTPIHERGLNVSGGQLQRLALARALVAAADVLVLDEALSQLDADTAGLIRARLTEYRAGSTIIEITHRADLVADQRYTVVLDAGRVIEHGPAGDLRVAGAAFKRLESRTSTRAWSAAGVPVHRPEPRHRPADPAAPEGARP